MLWNYDVDSDCLTVTNHTKKDNPSYKEVKLEHFTQIFVKEKTKNNQAKNNRRYPNAMQKWVDELVDTFGYDREDALFTIADWYLDLLGTLSAKEMGKVVDRAFLTK